MAADAARRARAPGPLQACARHRDVGRRARATARRTRRGADMNFAAAETIAKTVLYEGYVLYPYRPSAIKNRQRWTFGGVYPRGESSAAEGGAPLRCECVVEGDSLTRIEIRLRFLHLVTRQVF